MLKIIKIEFFEVYCLYNNKFISQFRGLNNSYITNIAKTAMLKLDLWIVVKVVDKLPVLLYKNDFFNADIIEYKKSILSIS